MLAFLLFAGSINVSLEELGLEWLTVSLLAIFGTLVSTCLVGGVTWLVLGWLASLCSMMGWVQSSSWFSCSAPAWAGPRANDSRSLVLTLAYFVVVFSILVQGLTVGRVIRMTSNLTRRPRSLLQEFESYAQCTPARRFFRGGGRIIAIGVSPRRIGCVQATC